MIKANISREYPAHMATCNYSDKSLYLTDYTEQTKLLAVKRGVEIFEDVPPSDIEYFTLKNDVILQNGFIKFDNTSFLSFDRKPLSQCECVIFPETSTINSWIFFAELKYNEYKTNKHIRKAICQLYKTRSYYFSKGIFAKSNPCYLLASLPKKVEPFAQSVISPPDLIRLKNKHNVILRLQNSAIIQDDKIINV